MLTIILPFSFQTMKQFIRNGGIFEQSSNRCPKSGAASYRPSICLAPNVPSDHKVFELTIKSLAAFTGAGWVNFGKERMSEK